MPEEAPAQKKSLDKPEVGEYKGNPILSIPVGKSGRPFSFGYQKAKAILLSVEEIRAFVSSVEEKEKE
ncbi:MAG: hypothetical protein PHP59_11090 [Methanofollis sp.]|uniref:hypothetical protein n=1 Tax=Methanofollis sp. TaxID=2052835 RepID=UPI002627A57C|nr:hypothetical protein [Methanofollis sp.]MDD4255905.1 hypothetical protein [Methanofollis sp.]